ncbi:hypothetical protein LEM8419_03348 [Neolewinella maritima]|uniref:Uncharacterized protein n=1 Tax=Neolewinella maritima TaxID=1383882 RepID=A0ABM9B5J9_9BACT|nr:hypothetical protein LEM8419_03348 [Neolewinella maritima]
MVRRIPTLLLLFSLSGLLPGQSSPRTTLRQLFDGMR